MLYPLLRLPLWICFFFYFRRIYWINKQYIPKDKPTIIIANHSNAFIDPVLLAAFQFRGLYFWARANEFRTAIGNWFMTQVHVLPIHRIRDGKELMYKNNETFDKSKKLLQQGHVLFVAPEGNCYNERRLRPFKDGTARLAFEFLELYPEEDLHILPASINYSSASTFRSEVAIAFNKPIRIKDYLEQYKTQPVETIHQLTEDLYKAVQAQMIHVQQPTDELLVEAVLTLHKNNLARPVFPVFSFKADYLQQALAVSNKVQQLSNDDKEVIEQKIQAYSQLLQKHSLGDFGVANEARYSNLDILLAYINLPIILIGKLTGYIPMQWANAWRNKVVQDITFRSSIGLAFGLIAWTFYSILILVISAFWLGWWALIIPPSLVIVQYISIHYSEQLRQAQTIQYYRHWKAKNLQIHQEILQKRQEILDYTA